MNRLTKEQILNVTANKQFIIGERVYGKTMFAKIIAELLEYKNIEEQLGIDLITFLKGVNPDTCLMEITNDKRFYFCGDAYYGTYSKERLLKLIEELMFMYWALTKDDLSKDQEVR